MAIMEHYDEVLDVLGELFVYIFDGLKEKCGQEMERIKEQHGFEDLQYLRKTLKIDYATVCRLLREAGVDQDDLDDLSTENEKKLGDIVKEKYNTDFYIMDKYPLSVRPFYTMPDPNVSITNMAFPFCTDSLFLPSFALLSTHTEPQTLKQLRHLHPWTRDLVWGSAYSRNWTP
jgi:aspartyl-tRNA synthetase